MDADEFRRRGKEMIDYVADYLETIRNRQVYPDVEPGYLRPLLPAEAPTVPDKWEDLIKDIERVIMPGVTHWQSPQFHAYYPTANSYPAICADILSDALGIIGSTWATSPACTELEVVMLDWLGKMLNLPPMFLSGSGGEGGGNIQGTASESTLMTLLSARTQAISMAKRDDPSLDECSIINTLVAYMSEEAHSSVERAGMLGAVRMRKVQSDKLGALHGSTLDDAIAEDKKNGLIPFYVCVTLGTMACAFDKLADIGPICEKHNIWLHIDAAYAGSAFICPEFRPLLNGVEYATSFNFNPHKWMLVNFDCSVLWVKDTKFLTEAFKVDPIYLKHDHQENRMPDYRHWQLGFGRRFRSLKLWFVLRLYGQLGLQEYIRNHVRLAHMFEEYVNADSRFEIIGEVVLGLVCFRIKGSNDVNEKLLKKINEDRRIHIVPYIMHATYLLRFAICSAYTTAADITFAWKTIQEVTQKLLETEANAYPKS